MNNKCNGCTLKDTTSATDSGFVCMVGGDMEKNHCHLRVLGLVRGDEYNFVNQPERLKYIGKKGSWHQFEKMGEWGVWREVLDENLYLIEKTRQDDK